MRRIRLPRIMRSPGRRRILAVVTAAVSLSAVSVEVGALAAPPAARPAHATRLAVGISDNSADLFRDPRFRWLGVRIARIIVPWDVVSRPRELAWEAAWLQGALADGVRPLVAFNGDPSHPGHGPSLAAYAKAIVAFKKLFPWVLDYTPWNEENHPLQPTGANPRLAADYYNVLSGHCHGCSITAADVLDTPNMVTWLRGFLHWAYRPRLWGLHSYVDVGLGSHERTSQLLRLVHGQVWFTEGGGVVWRWERPYNSSHASYIVHPEAHAAELARRLLSLATISSRITRVYYYQWRVPHTLQWARAHGSISWDSGLLRPDCSTRPAFSVIARAVGRNPVRMPHARYTRAGGCV